MTAVIEKTQGSTRNQPISNQLRSILLQAGISAQVDEVIVISGGQCARGTCQRRVGSTRHDLGNAADLELWRGNRPLIFTSSNELPVFEAFVRAAASLGATGIGAGPGYMGGKQRIHVGFGSKAVWGKDGKAANAPAWLKAAVAAGWSGSTLPLATQPFVVRVRDVLLLRAGPGKKFKILDRLQPDTVVHVSGYSGKHSSWARVDLHDDGLIDGFVHKDFLAPAGGLAGACENDEEGCCNDDCERRPKQTVGIRNNNYLNVKNNPQNPWKGSVGSDDRGHAVFDDPAFGLRAAIVTLRSYWFRHNKRTIAEILARWAPATDTIGSLPGALPNSPGEYAEFVSDRIGLPHNDQLELFSDNEEVMNRKQLGQLVKAMAEFENYAGFEFPESLLQKAFDLI